MELKYIITANGLLKISEIIILAIASDYIVELIIGIENSENSYVHYPETDVWGDHAPWQYYIFSVLAILVAILTLVALVTHLIMPAWMKLNKAKVAKGEIVFCVVLAILVLVGSVCLSFVLKEVQDENVAICTLGFMAVFSLLLECVFLYRTIKSDTSYHQEQLI